MQNTKEFQDKLPYAPVKLSKILFFKKYLNVKFQLLLRCIFI